eukprot:c8255_g1_i1.p1 GENE.c8255_g1_i1~~c8255_g1_i1.p1  ORF type:complete len:467 (-),score=97.82 c8255_g1_i1:106-1473(-)
MRWLRVFGVFVVVCVGLIVLQSSDFDKNSLFESSLIDSHRFNMQLQEGLVWVSKAVEGAIAAESRDANEAIHAFQMINQEHTPSSSDSSTFSDTPTPSQPPTPTPTPTPRPSPSETLTTQVTQPDNTAEERLLAIQSAKPPRFVISVTTIPARLPYLIDVFKAISWNNYHPDAVYLAIPRKSLRFEQDYILPEYIREHPVVKVLWSDVDYGPATKLLPVLKVETDPDTCIMTVDDDSFPKDFHIHLFITAALLFPDAALGFGGWNVQCIVNFGDSCRRDWDMKYGPDYLFVRQNYNFACVEMRTTYGRYHCAEEVSELLHPKAADVLEGTEGAVYRRKFFDDSIFDSSGTPKEMFFVDDVWISGNLALKGVPRLVVASNEKVKTQLIPVPAGRPHFPECQNKQGSYETLPEGWKDPGSIHALHAREHMDLRTCNQVAVKHFAGLGAWTKVPLKNL